MKFEIVDKEGTLITDFDLEANPFKVGERISVRVNNYDKEFWTVEDVQGEYMIDKIEHYFSRDYYTANKKSNSRFCVSVEVTKLP
jgi:hypothetical protein